MRICNQCEEVARELYTFRDGVPLHLANICKARHLEIVDSGFTRAFDWHPWCKLHGEDSEDYKKWDREVARDKAKATMAKPEP